MPDQSNREKALASMGTTDAINSDGTIYALFDLADAIREQTKAQETWLAHIERAIELQP